MALLPSSHKEDAEAQLEKLVELVFADSPIYTKLATHLRENEATINTLLSNLKTAPPPKTRKTLT